MNIFCLLLQLYALALFARVILSWFPIDRNGPMGPVLNVLFQITEPILGPIRAALPGGGMMDFSPIIVFIAIELLLKAMGCTISIL